MKPKHKKSRKRKRTHPSQMLSYSRYGYQKQNESDYEYMDPDSYEKKLFSILLNIQEEDINFSVHAFDRLNQRHIGRDDVVDIILNKMPLYIDKGDFTYDFKLVYSSYKDFNELVVVISVMNHQKIMIKTVYGKENPMLKSRDKTTYIEDYQPEPITEFLNCPFCGKKVNSVAICIHGKCPHCEHPIDINDKMYSLLIKLGIMCEKGLFTEEEFSKMKQNLINGKNKNICQNCGAEVSTDSQICSECGTKINF